MSQNVIDRPLKLIVSSLKPIVGINLAFLIPLNPSYNKVDFPSQPKLHKTTLIP